MESSIQGLELQTFFVHLLGNSILMYVTIYMLNLNYLSRSDNIYHMLTIGSIILYFVILLSGQIVK